MRFTCFISETNILFFVLFVLFYMLHMFTNQPKNWLCLTVTKIDTKARECKTRIKKKFNFVSVCVCISLFVGFTYISTFLIHFYHITNKMLLHQLYVWIKAHQRQPKFILNSFHQVTCKYMKLKSAVWIFLCTIETGKKCLKSLRFGGVMINLCLMAKNKTHWGQDYSNFQKPYITSTMWLTL